MTTNEIIKEIAVYDEYTHKETVTGDGVFTREEDQEGHEDIFTYVDLEDYLTDLNILHRVAVKVVASVYEIMKDKYEYSNLKIHEVIANLYRAIWREPVNGEYITLATATAEAIIYLKKYKS